MTFTKTLSIVGVHAEGEVGDVVIGGVLDPPNCNTMYEKMVHFRDQDDSIRQLVLNEPRGRSSMNSNMILPPCNTEADAGFIIMESMEYAPMSGSNVICVATVLLETGMLAMRSPVTEVNLDAPAGLIKVEAECEAGKCKSVAFTNVPAFVYELDYAVQVPGLGEIKVDIAWGGTMFALVDAGAVGLAIDDEHGPQLIDVGERIKRAIRAAYTPVHPENPDIRGVSELVFTHALTTTADNEKAATNTVVVSPGRFDRSPCGTGTCARLAVMYARGQLAVGEKFVHRSIIGSEFESWILSTTKIGDYEAVVPKIRGRAWITGHRTALVDSTDPWPAGFRVGDQWLTGKGAKET
ncbi:hypothetical protein MBLNU230_g2149t1 [Neophaeotheca triangularis]